MELESLETLLCVLSHLTVDLRGLPLRVPCSRTFVVDSIMALMKQPLALRFIHRAFLRYVTMRRRWK